MAHRFTLSVLLDLCDKFDLWLWITIDSLEHATSFHRSIPTTTCCSTQHREYTSCSSKSPDFQKPRWLPAALTTFFSHNSFEGTPALRRSSRRKSFGWNAAEKHSYVFWKTTHTVDLASWLERFPKLFCPVYRLPLQKWYPTLLPSSSPPSHHQQIC